MVEFEEHDVARDLWVSIRVYPMSDGIAVYVQDSTERKQLEARLLQSQKLEVVGQLASGIAHDFNNLLMVVDAYASLAQSEIDPAAESLGRSLQKIRAAAASGSALTAKLLAFSRTQASSSTAVDVNAVVSSALDLVAPLIGERIEVHRRLDPDAGCALLDAAQMEQVIVNLAVNARDAMGATGNLYVETHGIDPGADSVAGMRHGPYVSISVRDDGCGMDEQTLKQIFDPFFTTKPVGEGTGLGLSTADATVRQCGGEIDAISAPGEGTTFTIYVRGSGETVAAPELLGAISQWCLTRGAGSRADWLGRPAARSSSRRLKDRAGSGPHKRSIVVRCGQPAHGGSRRG